MPEIKIDLDTPLRIVIVNKSDSTGGAAVVSRRLMEALRQEGADAVMLVVEKKTDSPFVVKAASPWLISWKFLTERLRIFIANGFSKQTLFRIDTGETGLPLWKHPLIKRADAVLINWVNQGMLSLRGVEKIKKSGIPVIWTMHDMWNMTGICHHAGNCSNYLNECGNCPLLGKRKSPKDLSNRIWKIKNSVYDSIPSRSPQFVAVSSWLADKAKKSKLLGASEIEVIPNPFPFLPSQADECRREGKKIIRIIFGAARIDDPIKGLDDLKKVAEVISSDYPELAERIEILAFGTIKDKEKLDGFKLPIRFVGPVQGEEAIKDIYMNGDLVVSASSYETLPGTLVEAQAYGCIPVSYDRGGQKDIVSHLLTGYLANYSEIGPERVRNLAEGIKWAVTIIDNKEAHENILRQMKHNVREKFSFKNIAIRYLRLIRDMQSI